MPLEDMVIVTPAGRFTLPAANFVETTEAGSPCEVFEYRDGPLPVKHEPLTPEDAERYAVPDGSVIVEWQAVATIAATLSEAYKVAESTYPTDDAHEITEDAYYEALEVLPPIYGSPTETQISRFWVSEPWTHHGEVAVCLECWQERDKGFRSRVSTGRYFCRMSDCPKYRF